MGTGEEDISDGWDDENKVKEKEQKKKIAEKVRAKRKEKTEMGVLKVGKKRKL